MKSLDFINKYKLQILSILLIIFFIGSCNRGRTIKKLNRTIIQLESKIDSISASSDSLIKDAKAKHYDDLESIDTWISRKDRDRQLMELHPIIKEMKSNAYTNQ